MIETIGREEKKVNPSVLNRIAFYQGRRDEAPNQQLARELVQQNDREGVREIVQNLRHSNPNVQSDCLKVLYEIGYLNPQLIAGYVEDFLSLLKSRNNRLVWGSMIALSTIAYLCAEVIYPHAAEIQHLMEQGSVITRDHGIKVLATVAAQNDTYRKNLFPYLLKHLETCRPKDVPQHAESILIAVNADNQENFVHVLQTRMADMSASQTARLQKIIRAVTKFSNNGS